jgi:hypothetical protein
MLFDWSRKLDYTIDCGALAITLEVGDNFVVNEEAGNLEGQDFWIILYTRYVHQVKKVFQDRWGTSFEVGNEVVTSLYYQKRGTSDSTFVLLKDSHPIFMHSHIM